MKGHRIPYMRNSVWVGLAHDFISSRNEMFLIRKDCLMCSLSHTRTYLLNKYLLMIRFMLDTMQ